MLASLANRMPNSLKTTTGERSTLALQVTREARSAGLVEEDVDGEATYRAPVRVYAFEDALLVVDRDRVDDAQTAALVSNMVRDTKTAYDAEKAMISHAGNGYRVQLPPAQDAGFRLDDEPAAVRTAPNLLIIARTRQKARLADDIATIRNSQVSK